MKLEEVREIVGHHDYVGLEARVAVDKVQEKCPPGWKATYLPSERWKLPVGGVRVGQVRVRPTDQPLPLVVLPEY